MREIRTHVSFYTKISAGIWDGPNVATVDMPILCFVVMNVMEETLLDCQQRRRSDDDNDTGPYKIADALITAAIEGGGVHLDLRNIITITVLIKTTKSKKRLILN